MATRRLGGSTIALAAVLLGTLLLIGAGPTPSPSQPTKSDICPVCGMFVAPHPGWVAQVVFEDGATEYFDGPKDLFKYLRYPGKYDREHPSNEIEAVFVTTYYDRSPVAARDAFYVLGSDVLGPMGAELVPHGSRDEAEEFMADHDGDRIVSYDEVTAELIDSLN